MVIGSPVRGLRPSRPARSTTLNEPKPLIETSVIVGQAIVDGIEEGVDRLRRLGFRELASFATSRMRSCLRTLVLLSASTFPRCRFPNWLPSLDQRRAEQAGHLVTPTVRRPSLPSIRPSSPRKPANIRGNWGAAPIIDREESPQVVLSARARRRCRAASKRMTAPGHGRVERLDPVVQRDADLLGAPRLQLGADAFRLAADDQRRRSGPVARHRRVAWPRRWRPHGAADAAAARRRAPASSGMSGTRKCAPIPARTTFGFQGSTVSGER